MKVLLMSPVSIYKRWPFEVCGQRYFADVPSVNLSQLAACIPNHDCQILDGIVDSIDIKEFMRKIKSADIIGISVPSNYLALNVELNIRLIKRVAPEVKIILGGHHATAFHQDWVEKEADFVVRREGEIAFAELIEAIEKNKDFKNIKGITYKNDGKIIVNDDREFIENLDDLPIPRWDTLDFSKYNFFYSKKGLVGSIETSRGCQFRCSFCMASAMWKHSQRYKSIDRVMEELKVLKNRGVTKLYFVDESLGENYSRDREIFEKMIKERLTFVWSGFFRLDSVLKHLDMIESAGRSGCKLVFIGFENLDPKRLKEYKKGYIDNIQLESYIKAYEAFRKNDILVCGLFLIGNIDESEYERRKIINFVKKCRYKICDIAFINQIVPSPMTELYEQAKQKGLILKDMFYHENYILCIEGTKLKYNSPNMFGLRETFNIFNQRQVLRDFFISYYRVFLKNLINLNFNSFIDFLTLKFSFKRNPRQRQQGIINKYTKKLMSASDGIHSSH